MSGAEALAYHEATKHSPQSVRRGGRPLDWSNKPSPFKVYRGCGRLPLPSEFSEPDVPALSALHWAVPAGRVSRPGVESLSCLLWLGAGAHRRRRFPGGEEIRFRTYASAGALYPNEVYVVGSSLAGLDAGVYHFDPAGRSLAMLRPGDQRSFLVRAAGEDPAVAQAPVLLVITGIPWRTGWKYGDRGYRHLFWDAGMILANLSAVAAAEGLAAHLATGFVDSEVEALLGLHPSREFPLCLVAVGAGSAVAAAADAPSPVRFGVEPLSPVEEALPAVGRVNDAGRLERPSDVAGWRTRADRLPRRPRAPAVAVEGTSVPDPIGAVIRRRGSARVFGRGAIPRRALSAILRSAADGILTCDAPTGSVAEPYVIANAVDGLDPGAYAFEDGGLRPLREGSFRGEAGYLCLEQRLAADAAATVFLMCDLSAVLGPLGDRGYRVAQLGAGIAAGRMYLASYALGWGATGLTFYDDEVTRFFSPDAEGKACMLVVAVGESVRRQDLLPVR